MAEADAIATTVRDMVQAINHGDFVAAVAAFSETPVIVEDLFPFRWHGAGAASEWLSAMGENAGRLNATAVIMTLRDPTRIQVEAEAAYALFPGQLRLTTASANLVAEGTLTFTLQNSGGRWLIDTLVWSGLEPAP